MAINEIFEYVKRKVDLLEYIESDLGFSVRHQGDDVGVSLRPFHGDSVPSFRINYLQEDGIWLYYCFGCGATGTVIDFFQRYHGLSSAYESVKFICEKFNIEVDNADFEKLPPKKVNIKKKMECMNIIVSNQCRLLLRNDYKNHSKWVAKAYNRLNDAMVNQDMEELERINDEAFGRIS